MADYASKTDVAAFLAVDEGTLSADVDRMISRASEDAKHYARYVLDESNADHMAAMKNAVCAQVEFWLSLGTDSISIINPKGNVKIGTFSMNGELSPLAPRAKRFLMAEGLLYRGVGMW